MPPASQIRMRQQLRDFALRLVICAAILITLGRVFGATLVSPILPALAWEIEAADDRFHVDQVKIVKRQTDTIIQLKVRPVRALMFGNRVLLPDSSLFFEPSILVGSVLQPVILFLSIMVAWPTSVPLREMALRQLLAIPATLLLLSINIPLGQIGAMLDYRQYLPNAPVSLIVYWNDFLQSGGPSAISIAAAALVVSVAHDWTRARERMRTIDNAEAMPMIS